MGEGVYVEGKADIFFCSGEDFLSTGHTSVVYQDCGGTDVFADFFRDFRDGRGGSDVAFVVVDVGC